MAKNKMCEYDIRLLDEALRLVERVWWCQYKNHPSSAVVARLGTIIDKLDALIEEGGADNG